MAEIALRRPPSPGAGSYWRPLPPCARYALRVNLVDAAAAAGSALPVATAACRASVQGDWAALWLGPDEQLLIGPEPAGAAFADAVASALQGVSHSVVDVSHRQGAIEITGPHAAALVNAGCPLDLDLAATPAGFCSRTVFAKAEIVLWRRGNEHFHLEIWRSFMPYLAAFLSEVERELPGQGASRGA